MSVDEGLTAWAQLLLAFGAGKPAVIMEMERRIWLTLVDLAKGERQAVARVTRTLNEIDELVQSMDLGEMRGWFSGGQPA